MIAQISTPSVPNDLKAWLECFCYVAGFGLLVVMLVKGVRGPRPSPPNEQLGATAEDLKQRVKGIESHAHLDYERQLADHANQLGNLWTTMRAENTAIRKEGTEHYEAIKHALGRIEGALEVLRSKK